jgi:PAS domain S-box-containing protein
MLTNASALRPQIATVFDPRRNSWFRYVIAFIAFVASLTVRFALNPWLGSDRGFIIFVPAIILTTFIAGFGPAVFAAVLAGVAISYFFVPAYGSFGPTADGMVGLATYVIGATAGIVLVHRLRTTNTRLDAERARAEELARQQTLLNDALQIAKQRLEFSLEASGAATWGWNVRENTLDQWTLEYQRLFGFGPNDPETIEIWLARIHPTDRSHITNRMTQIMENAGDDIWSEEFRIIHPDKGERWIFGLGRAFRDSSGRAIRMAGVNMDITDRKRAEEREQLLVRELQHRTKNFFAVVQAIAARTLTGQQTLHQAREAFVGRLMTLARADYQLTSSKLTATSLQELLDSEMAPFAGRYVASGPNVLLPANVVQNFALAVHELATNAAKYGAFGTPDGRILISWTMNTNGEADSVKFAWRETGGPTVVKPERSGFGTSLLTATLGHARIEFAPDGFRYEVDVPIASVNRTAKNDTSQPKTHVRADE